MAPDQGEVTREELHFRRIDMRGYKRSDGLFEIEGRVTDRKPHDFTSPNGTRRVPANEPMHDMGVRLVIDSDMVVKEVVTFTDSSPYTDCIAGGQSLQAIKGLRIGAGWSRALRERLPSSEVCTHMKELLVPLASAAYQALTEHRRHLPDTLDTQGRPVKIDSCYAYGATRSLVLRRWPDWARPPEASTNTSETP